MTETDRHQRQIDRDRYTEIDRLRQREIAREIERQRERGNECVCVNERGEGPMTS